MTAPSMDSKIVVTLVGKDHAGIIAAVCTYFAENDINILDLSMTTVEDYINMMMIVDVKNYKKNLPGLVNDLDAVGEKVGCKVSAQKAEIFNMMHRI